VIKEVLSWKIVRYGVVGVLSNLSIYLLYLLITFYDTAPKIALSFVYVIGVLQSFFLNKKWTFRHNGHVSETLIRYLIIYGFGYCINLGALIIYVDRFGYPHQWVQGIMIPVVAIFLFVLQKIWVFHVQD